MQEHFYDFCEEIKNAVNDWTSYVVNSLKYIDQKQAEAVKLLFKDKIWKIVNKSFDAFNLTTKNIS